MVETQTPLLRLTQPDVGGSNNTWGDTLNDSIFAIDALYRDRGGRSLLTADTPTAVLNYTYAPAFVGGSTGDPNFVPLASTLFIRARVDVANTGRANLDYDNKGNKPIKKLVNNEVVDIVKGDMPKEYFAELLYNTGIEPPGCWFLLNPARSDKDFDIGSINQICSHKNLTFERINPSVDLTHARIKADTVILKSTTDGSTRKFSGGIQEDIDLLQGGIGGIQGPGVAVNTWYSFYLVGKTDGSVIDAIASVTRGGPGPNGGVWNTVPALPGGYTYYGFVGCARTDASKHYVGFHQAGNMVTIVDAAPITPTLTGTGYVAVDLSDYVPPEALAVRVSLKFIRNVTTGGGGTPGTTTPFLSYVEAYVAPNTSFYGEVGLGGVGGVRGEATVMLRVANTIYVRTPDFVATSGTASMSLQVFVNGYWL